MPRPNLKAERTETILNAVEKCVIRYGVHGTTLENIAEASGLRRSLLRHNIGNRDKILKAFMDRFFESSDRELAAMLDCLPKENPIDVLLALLFDDYQSTSQMALVALSLTAAAASDGAIAKRLTQWNQHFIDTLATVLRNTFADANETDCYQVATGLAGIFFNTESLAPLGRLAPIREASKGAAQRLINSLNK